MAEVRYRVNHSNGAFFANAHSSVGLSEPPPVAIRRSRFPRLLVQSPLNSGDDNTGVPDSEAGSPGVPLYEQLNEAPAGNAD